MKERMSVLFIAVCVITFLSWACAVYADEFSANIISTTKEGSHQGKIFVAKDKVRMEIMASITICRMDKNVTWMLLPNEKMYMELPFKSENIVITKDRMTGEISRRFIKSEIIDGRAADKYEVSYNAAGKNESSYIWVAKGLNFPIKNAAIDGSWSMEYRNVKEGPQPVALFEIPSGYKPFNLELPVLSPRE